MQIKMRGNQKKLLILGLGVGAMTYLLHILSVMIPVYFVNINCREVVVGLSCIVWCCFSLICLCGLIAILMRDGEC